VCCYGDHLHLHSFPTRRSSDLKSRDFLRKVLVESLELFPEASGEDNKGGTVAGSLSHEELEWRLEKFAERIAVNQTLSSSVISIGYTSESPERAADVVNLLVSLYRKLLREEEEAAQKGELEHLGKRISALQRNIDQSRARLLMLLQSRPASGSRPEGRSQLAELEAEVHTSAQLLAELLRRQAEARRSLEMIDPKIRVVSLASSPVSRSSLHPALFIG